MPYTTNGRNEMLDALTATHASLHTGLPGDAGANEVSGGTYARQAITFAAAAAGARDSSNQPVFDVPAGTTVAYVAFWDAITAGNCKGYKQVTSETFSNAGTYTLTDADLDLNLTA